MGFSNNEKFTKEQNDVAKVAKALSHPARVAILEFITKQDSCICGDIVEELPLSQSTVSQHLKELKEAGLIKGTIEGPKTCYCVDEAEWNKSRALLDNFMELKDTVTCC